MGTTFHLHGQHSVGMCNIPGRTKVSLGSLLQMQQEVGQFEICAKMTENYTCHSLPNSSDRFSTIDFKFGIDALHTFVMKSYQKITFSSENVSMTCHRNVVKRYKTGSCHNFSIHCPICSKLYMHNRSPALNTST